ncbi:MAG: UPF0758 domain-containing protein [Candidatus Omnitrophota bacterium]
MVKKRKAAGIKTWPEDDRPREKLLKKGAGALSNSKLLAILLRTGTNGTSTVDLARKVLKKVGSFRNMAHTDARDWKDLKGLGGAKIAHIQAALEIRRRYRRIGVRYLACADRIQHNDTWWFLLLLKVNSFFVETILTVLRRITYHIIKS